MSVYTFQLGDQVAAPPEDVATAGDYYKIVAQNNWFVASTGYLFLACPGATDCSIASFQLDTDNLTLTVNGSNLYRDNKNLLNLSGGTPANFAGFSVYKNEIQFIFDDDAGYPNCTCAETVASSPNLQYVKQGGEWFTYSGPQISATPMQQRARRP